MTKPRDFCVDCWWDDLHTVGENLGTVFEDLAALCSRRPLRAGERDWHPQLERAIRTVFTAQRELEGLFEAGNKVALESVN
jgi:hypothetical protein